MIKFKDIKKGDLIVLKNGRDVIGTIVGVSDSKDKTIFYIPESKYKKNAHQANYKSLMKRFDIIRISEKEQKKSRKISIRTYIKKRLGMI